MLARGPRVCPSLSKGAWQSFWTKSFIIAWRSDFRSPQPTKSSEMAPEVGTWAQGWSGLSFFPPCRLFFVFLTSLFLVDVDSAEKRSRLSATLDFFSLLVAWFLSATFILWRHSGRRQIPPLSVGARNTRHSWFLGFKGIALKKVFHI